MKTLPFLEGFEQFRDPDNLTLIRKLAMGGWMVDGPQVAIGAGRYGDAALTCRRTFIRASLPTDRSLYFGFATNKTGRGQIAKISAGEDSMVLYTSRLDGFIYLDDINLEAIPLNNLWYFYEFGIADGQLTIRVNDREMARVPLKPGIAEAPEVQLDLGAKIVIPKVDPADPNVADETTSSFDDFYANNDGFMGTIYVQTRFPTTTLENQWQVSGEAYPHAAVGRIPFDPMSRYIAEEQEGNISEFASNRIIPDNYPILATGIVMVARKPSSLDRAIEVSISDEDGQAEARNRVVQVENQWSMSYVVFPKVDSDTAENLRLSPFAVKLVNS